MLCDGSGAYRQKKDNGGSGPAGDDNVACMVGEEQGCQSGRGLIN
jgi:hypothetical protein